MLSYKDKTAIQNIILNKRTIEQGIILVTRLVNSEIAYLSVWLWYRKES